MIAALPETTRKLPVIKGRVQTPDIPDSLRGLPQLSISRAYFASPRSGVAG